jgi:hypothetical protein
MPECEKCGKTFTDNGKRKSKKCWPCRKGKFKCGICGIECVANNSAMAYCPKHLTELREVRESIRDANDLGSVPGIRLYKVSRCK